VSAVYEISSGSSSGGETEMIARPTAMDDAHPDVVQYVAELTHQVLAARLRTTAELIEYMAERIDPATVLPVGDGTTIALAAYARQRAAMLRTAEQLDTPIQAALVAVPPGHQMSSAGVWPAWAKPEDSQ
jgi:hypothetical protein